MFWFMLNNFLMISAILQVRGLNQNSLNISNSFHHTKNEKNEPNFLILNDIQGNMYKYIYPNDIDQFSKMSTLGNKNSSTVIHLPPGILKTENPKNSSSETGVNSIDRSNFRISSTTSEGQRVTNPINTTNERTKSVLGSKSKDINKNKRSKNPPTVYSLWSTTKRTNSEVDNTTVSIKENESTETTTQKNDKNEHEAEKEEDDITADEYTLTPILKSTTNATFHGNNTKENSNNSKLLMNSNEKYNKSNEQYSLYKSCDSGNGLILLVENDIKLKLIFNSNGILDKSFPMDNTNNPTIKSKDKLSTKDEITNDDFPISIGIAE